MLKIDSSQNIGNLEHMAETSARKVITKETADSLLRHAQYSWHAKNYAVTRILAGLAKGIYEKLDDGWNAHIANGWYESANGRLQTIR